MSTFKVKFDSFKREDNTTGITVQLIDEEQRTLFPNQNHTWKAKINSDGKYVGEYPMTTQGNSVVLSSSELVRLPAGEYGLEVWESDGDNVTIYPSRGFVPFTINKNADDGMTQQSISTLLLESYVPLGLT